MKKTIAFLCLLTLLSCATPQQKNAAMEQSRPDKGADLLVHEYLEATGTKSNMQKFQKVMLGQMKANLERMIGEKVSSYHYDDPSQKAQMVLLVNEATSNFVSRFEKAQQELMPFEEVERRIVGPVIRKHFTDDELTALISFYKSPVGKKYVASINSMMQEIMTKTNQVYGQQLYELSKTIAEEELDQIIRQRHEGIK